MIVYYDVGARLRRFRDRQHLDRDDLTRIVEKREIEHVDNNERDVSKDRDIELIVRWDAENEDVLFNVLDALDLT